MCRNLLVATRVKCLFFISKSFNSFCVVVLCLSVNHPYIYPFMMTKMSKLQPSKMDEAVTRVGEETNV